MVIEYTGRQTEITQKLKVQAEAGLARIATIAGKVTSAHVILTEDKYRQIAEVTLVADGVSMVATCEAAEMKTSLHDALARLEQQAVRRRQKTTTSIRHPRGESKIGDVMLNGPAASLSV